VTIPPDRAEKSQASGGSGEAKWHWVEKQRGDEKVAISPPEIWMGRVRKRQVSTDKAKNQKKALGSWSLSMSTHAEQGGAGRGEILQMLGEKD
jgi:hypothetical protein